MTACTCPHLDAREPRKNHALDCPVRAPAPEPDDIIRWPDGTMCFRDELAEFSHKSDDYEVVHLGTPAYEAALEELGY